MRLLPFLLRVWLSGWVAARLAPYVLFFLLIFCLALTWLTNTIYHQIGLDKLIRLKNGHMEWVEHR